MRQSRINPKLSAYAQLHGIHDYNAHPVAPPGIQVLIHEKSNVRKTWSLHGVEGWYLGPAMEHYRCYRVIASKTGGERITDTVQFFPHDIPMPGTSAADRAAEAAIELTDAISNFKHPVAPPGIQILIHGKSNVRKTWSLHGVEGWYLGPAMEHYRCYRVIASKTGEERITDTIQFCSHDIHMPGTSAADRAAEAAIELTDAISNFKHIAFSMN